MSSKRVLCGRLKAGSRAAASVAAHPLALRASGLVSAGNIADPRFSFRLEILDSPENTDLH